jgi:hypothetical protein
MRTVRIPVTAKYLGYGGVAPFVLVLLNETANGPLASDLALRIFVFYGAVILSFLGGVRWGAATRLDSGMTRELLISIVPSLWAVACLLPSRIEWSVGGLLAGFVLMGLADFYAAGPALATWMRLLRARLTVAVALCHVVLAAML